MLVAPLPVSSRETRAYEGINMKTARGVARSIIRGVKANFAPENRQAELERIVEFFQDLAMSLEMTADLPGGSDVHRKDADALGDMACWIQEDAPGILLESVNK